MLHVRASWHHRSCFDASPQNLDPHRFDMKRGYAARHVRVAGSQMPGVSFFDSRRSNNPISARQMQRLVFTSTMIDEHLAFPAPPPPRAGQALANKENTDVE
ncbi:hypothetical protein [Burkholderia gladioli]|uniref:hypothetical protein n=1 Tax=Burkholderia gladioli TaxID=28095 RepID=UPI0016419484|nr:hypothetical protein [Burkholderia gladioli]